AASFDLPTTFGTSTVRPRTARYVIIPAPAIKTPTNNAANSKLLKILLKQCRESKHNLTPRSVWRCLELRFPFVVPISVCSSAFGWKFRLQVVYRYFKARPPKGLDSKQGRNS